MNKPNMTDIFTGISYMGIDFECYVRFTKPVKGFDNDMEPGQLYLDHVYIEDVEVTQILRDDVLEKLDELAWDKFVNV